MIHQSHSIVIPEDKRVNTNKLILLSIRKNETENLSQEVIFNGYTGKGGLHGLNRDNYSNYYEFSEDKKLFEEGQFFTSHEVCESLIKLIKPSANDVIGDLTCGIGNFFNYLPEQSNIYGVEKDQDSFDVARFLYPDANLYNEDIQKWESNQKFDIVFGNPPFNLSWNHKGDRVKSQMFYCLKSHELLLPGGLLVMVVPMSFLNDEFDNKSDIELINDKFSFVFQSKLPEDSFAYLGTKVNTKVIVLQKKSEHLQNSTFEADNFVSFCPDSLHNKYISPIREEKKRAKSKLLSEISFLRELDSQIYFKIEKYLYEINSHKDLQKHTSKALNLLSTLQNQACPEEMDLSEWNRVKLTPQKVAAQLKKWVSRKKTNKNLRIVKRNSDLVIKGVGKRNLNIEKRVYPISSLVIGAGENIPHEVQRAALNTLNYSKVIKAKKNNWQLHQSLRDIQPKEDVKSYLDNFTFVNPKDKNEYPLMPLQKTDLGKFISRYYSYMNWQQGSGKTVGAYAWGKYLMEQNIVNNIWVVSNALSIKKTWKDFFNCNDANYIQIKCIDDVNNIKPGQIVILNFELLIKLQRFVKKQLKINGYKIALIVDEADELCNYNSKRYRAVKNCFIKAKRKIIASGTPTRNNAVELYPQFELLYNNSYNFICECPTIFKEVEVKAKEVLYKEFAGVQIKEEDNDYYLSPFVGSRKGLRLFKNCFNPSKTSVFGIKKHNQDIYNLDILKALIERTVITRKFKDFAGDKYDIHNIQVVQNNEERAVYSRIFEETHQVLREYFANSGNSKKEAGLKYVRMIRLLLKATSVPHFFKEYLNKAVSPCKQSKILEMVKGWNNEQVAIGCTTKEAVYDYKNRIQKAFPERKVYVATGDINIDARSRVVEEFKMSTNGILICTQQSLKNSVNIPTCGKIIIESLQWNIPKVEQWFFRFIRLDSDMRKDVYFITYAGTIEQNMLGLLFSKEAINEFVKNLNYRDNVEVMKDYGVSDVIFKELITKEHDGENITFNWGKEKIA